MTELFRELVKWRVRIQLRVQLPLRACVCNLEASALGVALGITACCGDHHSQIASLIEGVAHSFLQEGGLQATPPQFWNGRRASEQRNSVMDAQHTGSASFAVNLGKKARTLVASGEDGAKLQQRFPKFRKFVRPSPCAYVSPELDFVWSDDAHIDMTLGDVAGVFGRGPLDRPGKNVADLDWPVVA
jgi:hypothetical protein